MPAFAADFEPVTPQFWPAYQGLSPRIEANANALRIWGPSRYETSLAAALMLRGQGGFPFDDPTSSSPGSSSLSESNAWWGPSICPKAVIIVAADSPADALAASALSDPTGQSHEPLLRRSAAADPLFDPIGGYRRVDTDFAPLLVTESARSGSTHLSIATRVGMQDFRSGGCRDARDAVIVGGPSAVPAGIEDELLSIGYREVFRIAGPDRYATAAAIATSLGTADIPEEYTGCRTRTSASGTYGMSYYANSVVEWRRSADECELLGRTVVIADGIAAVDALTAGWWTSHWQVPVLLHDGSDMLPSATRAALQTSDIDHVIILGGTERISNAISATVSELASASVHRVAGPDRFATSIEMAKFLGGWWPRTKGQVPSSSMMCIVGSAGIGGNSMGWSDALGAGPWCAASSQTLVPPRRALPPIDGIQPSLTGVNEAERYRAVPIFLIRAGSDSLPPVFSEYLEEIFPHNESWCSSLPRSGGCHNPGFGVVFGGPSVITQAAFDDLSRRLGGHAGPTNGPANSEVGFVTSLSMSPIYHEQPLGALKTCWPRSSYRAARWLSAGIDTSPRPLSTQDAYLNGWYIYDAQGQTEDSNFGSPACVDVPFDSSSNRGIWLQAAGPYGRGTSKDSYGVTSEDRLVLEEPLEAAAVNVGGFLASGIDLSLDPPTGGDTSLEYSSGDSAAKIMMFGQATVIESWHLTVVIRRGVQGSLDTFEASIRVDTGAGVVRGEATGEAAFFGGSWFLRGRSTTNAVVHRPGYTTGGFRLDIFPGFEGLRDDRIIWDFDGYVALQ